MKSTVVLDRLALLLVDVFVDHVIGNRAGRDREVAARPEVPAPELSLEMRELLQHEPRAGAFESPSEKEPSTIKELKVSHMANDVEVSSAFPVTTVDFTTTQLLAQGLVSA